MGDEMEQQTTEWPYLQELPAEWHGFSLVTDPMTCGTQERLFSYILPGKRRAFSVLYDAATKVYLAKTTVGLSEFCDPLYISAQRDNTEQALRDRMELLLAQLAGQAPGSFDAAFREKGILQWRLEEQLPAAIAGFERYISPAAAVRGINGSYIVLDYSDFDRNSNFILFYNVFRREFFAEFVIDQTPKVTTRYDCKTLEEAEQRLLDLLTSDLEQLRQQVG